MEAEPIIRILIILIGLAPGMYLLYLISNPWSREKRLRKLHQLGGDEWVMTEAGAMALDRERWIVYIYKWDESEE